MLMDVLRSHEALEDSWSAEVLISVADGLALDAGWDGFVWVAVSRLRAELALLFSPPLLGSLLPLRTAADGQKTSTGA